MSYKKEKFKSPASHKAEPVQERFVCAFPGCGKVFIKKDDGLPICTDHRKFIADLFFALKHFHPRAPKIIVPGPGQSIAAVRAAERVSKLRGG